MPNKSERRRIRRERREKRRRVERVARILRGQDPDPGLSAFDFLPPFFIVADQDFVVTDFKLDISPDKPIASVLTISRK